MSESSGATCWTIVRGAVEGRSADRELFARRYVPVVRAYLAARWRGTPLAQEVDDALQEVFVDCFKEGGALERADPDRSFRAFFYGVIRMVALRHEDRRRRAREAQPASEFDIEANEPALSRVFDRAWAVSIMGQAGERMAAHARQIDASALRRVELLRLRFQEDLPIREIAVLWGESPARLHHEYARARREFRAALEEVVVFHQPDAETPIDAECERLLGFFA